MIGKGMKKLNLTETLSYDDITLAPAYSELKSRSEANPGIFNFKLPIFASCMDTLGRNIMECIINNNIPFVAHRAFKSAKEQYEYFVPEFTKTAPFERYNKIWFAVGSVQKYKDWIDYLYHAVGVRNFCIDMAHGDCKACIDTIKYIKSLRTDIDICKTLNLDDDYLKSIPKETDADKTHVIAGNVATAEGFKRLQDAGADGIRVGIASGSICSTNIETGMGLPVLTSIIDCMKVKNKHTWLIADGGIRAVGDIVKAIFFGADFVMIGKLFASTDLSDGKCYNNNKEEIPSELTIYPETDLTNLNNFITTLPEEKQIKIAKELEKLTTVYKAYHGMASRAARNNILAYAAVEGVEGLIKYTGTTQQFITDTELRLKAAMSYAGAKDWTDFRKNTKAYKRSISGVHAADVHMDILTKFH
jgi:IMP dehydrogenase